MEFSMNNVIYFTPKNELDFEINLKDFVATCQKSTIWNADKIFEANILDIGHQKGQNKMIRAIFSTFEAPAKIDENGPFMSEPFLSFAKALLLYLESIKPSKSLAFCVAAMRAIEYGLRKLSKGSRPTAVNESVLDEARKILNSKGNSDAYIYKVLGQMQIIANVMNKKGIIALSREWQHGMKKPTEVGSRISDEAVKAREDKMPSEAAIRALGAAFHEARDPADVYVSSIAALLLCSPERINEALRLRRNALIHGEGRFKDKLALRWSGSKGFDDAARWLPTAMIPVAKQAVENLINVTNLGTEIANWYLINPDKLYYHEEANHLRSKQLLSSKEIALIIFGNEDKYLAANNFIKSNFIENVSSSRTGEYRRLDVEAALIKLLPKEFPYVNGDNSLLVTESIVAIRKNEFHSDKGTYLCMIEYANYSHIDNRLGADGRKSIFDKIEFTEDDGSRISINTHSFRHYLNTLAQMGGLSALEIAAFSGRKNIGQNKNYDHMTSDEVQAPIHNAIAVGQAVKVNIAKFNSSNLIRREDFQGLGQINAHTTAYGYCIHNFAAEPCQMHSDCINCQEQVCVKGEKFKEHNLRMLKEETEHLLSSARFALTNEEYGADRWVRHQERTLENIDRIIGIIDNPFVQNGALIKMNSETIMPVAGVGESLAKKIFIKRSRKSLK